MKIPFVDLKAQLLSIKPEIISCIDEIIESCAFIQGKYVKKFEDKFAKMHGAEYAVGCSNGTAAIQMALEVLGIGNGDEVITVSHTFISTVDAIVRNGAKPVFVDIDPQTYCINVSKIKEKLTKKTKKDRI